MALNFDYGSNRRDRGVITTTQDSVSLDIIDRLPSDPFDMDISTTLTAITALSELLEGFNFDYGRYRGNKTGTSNENYHCLFPDFNFILNNTMGVHTFPPGLGNLCFEEKNFQGVSLFGECSQREVGEAPCSFACGSYFEMDGMLGFDYNDMAIASMCSQREFGEASCSFAPRSYSDMDGMLGLGFDYKDMAIASVCSQREVGEASCSFAPGSYSEMDGVLGFGFDYKDVAIASACSQSGEASCSFASGSYSDMDGVSGFDYKDMAITSMCSQREVGEASYSIAPGSYSDIDGVLGLGFDYKDVDIASVCSQREVGEASCSFASGSYSDMDDVLGFDYKDMAIAGVCSQREVGETSCSFASGSSSDMDGILGLSCDYKDMVPASVLGDTYMDDVNYLEGDELSPHPALCFSLSYLGLSDLLVVERVCKSLCSNVRGDPLLWRNIHIEQPLSDKITDEILLELTNRAQGNLQCLSLVDCIRITDDGLRRVLQVNPKIIKLSVPGCSKLTIDGIVGMLKAYNSMGSQGLKVLHIGGIYGVTPKQFEDIKLLLGTDSQLQQQSHKPHFYCSRNLYLPCDDDRSLDIDVCPCCQKLRIIYDCPVEGCQGEVGHTTQVCRACTICIPRCSRCGRCINDSEYEETFCLEFICSSCSRTLARMDEKVGLVSSIEGKVGLVSSALPEQS